MAEKNTKESYSLFAHCVGFFDSASKFKEPPPSPAEVVPSEMYIHQMDVKTAFLNGDLAEEIYMEQPEGYVVPGQEHKDQSASKSNAEPIVITDGLTLLKGKVSTFDVFGVSNSDLVPGKYEGGLKLWEGSVDLVKALCSEVGEGKLMLNGKRVLELGCGHGLPGIFTLIKGAAVVHFQDFNAEVLQFLTIPNVKANLAKESDISPNVRFFSGDWSDIHQIILPNNCNDQQKATDDSSSDGYDIILMAETVYTLFSLQSLYDLIKKCLCKPSGVVYVAGKKHYFGVGGGTRQFLHVVEEDGVMAACLVAEVADGSSNVREVWKFSFKQD